MHIVNETPGRLLAACVHIVLTPDDFLYVSECVSPTVSRRACTSVRGLQLKAIEPKEVLGMIGLEELNHKPFVDGFAKVCVRVRACLRACACVRVCVFFYWAFRNINLIGRVFQGVCAHVRKCARTRVFVSG